MTVHQVTRRAAALLILLFAPVACGNDEEPTRESDPDSEIQGEIVVPGEFEDGEYDGVDCEDFPDDATGDAEAVNCYLDQADG